ncbi:RsbR, positive regulator of sigma-B [Chondromyces apiculatus DSM 436]|uniref:RsbR, positive regulator of sigma-B n=1 Tax=Chondromyces apiculatus DSM 436 TaxID=1192034 RepID=A0A017T942_9BACT|nr:STAS domain-containing protein [Chondromyces apiculatus]EYF05101.1 RsbR, positive regulator of sigma-B [Chondromyces apiculatus DSM 436]
MRLQQDRAPMRVDLRVGDEKGEFRYFTCHAARSAGGARCTPIIEVWDGVLTLPMFGILDSMRTSEVMDNLLDRITTNSSRFAILDMTGVEVVDTGVAGYLIQLVNAIRLLGAEGIVAGIRPTVAQTMITLGADLSQITTHRNLRAALGYCIRAMSKERSASR